MTFEEFLRIRLAGLVRLAVVLCGNRALGEDLVSAAVRQVYDDRARIADSDDAAGELRAWTVRGYLSEGMQLGNGPASDVDSPIVDAADADEDWDDLTARFVTSSKLQRTVAALHYLEGLDAETIADTIGSTPEGIERYLARVLLELNVRTDDGRGVDASDANTEDDVRALLELYADDVDPDVDTLATTLLDTLPESAADIAERERAEQAEREAAERAEQAEREAAEREAREQAERAEQERLEREQAEREEREREEREAREQAERAEQERLDRERAEQHVRELAERVAAEREAQARAAESSQARERNVLDLGESYGTPRNMLDLDESFGGATPSDDVTERAAQRDRRKRADQQARERAAQAIAAHAAALREQAEREAKEKSEREASAKAQREAEPQAERETPSKATREAEHPEGWTNIVARRTRADPVATLTPEDYELVSLARLFGEEDETDEDETADEDTDQDTDSPASSGTRKSTRRATRKAARTTALVEAAPVEQASRFKPSPPTPEPASDAQRATSLTRRRTTIVSAIVIVLVLIALGVIEFAGGGSSDSNSTELPSPAKNAVPGATVIGDYSGRGSDTLRPEVPTVASGRELDLNVVCAGHGPLSVGPVPVSSCGVPVVQTVTADALAELKVDAPDATHWRVVVTNQPQPGTNGSIENPPDAALDDPHASYVLAYRAGSGPSSVSVPAPSGKKAPFAVRIALACKGGAGVSITSSVPQLSGKYTHTCFDGWSYEFDVAAAALPATLTLNASRATSWQVAVLTN